MDVLTNNKKCDDIPNSKFEPFRKRAKSLLVIAPTAPTENYQNFTKQVQYYNSQDPFNFETSNLLTSYQYEKVRRILFYYDH